MQMGQKGTESCLTDEPMRKGEEIENPSLANTGVLTC
jgi:hypothetical protein